MSIDINLKRLNCNYYGRSLLVSCICHDVELITDVNTISKIVDGNVTILVYYDGPCTVEFHPDVKLPKRKRNSQNIN